MSDEEKYFIFLSHFRLLMCVISERAQEELL